MNDDMCKSCGQGSYKLNGHCDHCDAPRSSKTLPVRKTQLLQIMQRFPEVEWDRWSGNMNRFGVFGWIQRDDSRSDFVLLIIVDGVPAVCTSSSARYSKEFCERLDFDHGDCKRVEHDFPGVRSVKLLSERKPSMAVHKQEEHHIEFRDEEGTTAIDMKWDGCVNIERFMNGDTKDNHSAVNCDYIHICDLPAFIEQLQDVLRLARENGVEV